MPKRRDREGGEIGQAFKKPQTRRSIQRGRGQEPIKCRHSQKARSKEEQELSEREFLLMLERDKRLKKYKQLLQQLGRMYRKDKGRTNPTLYYVTCPVCQNEKEPTLWVKQNKNGGLFARCSVCYTNMYNIRSILKVTKREFPYGCRPEFLNEKEIMELFDKFLDFD